MMMDFTFNTIYQTGLIGCLAYFTKLWINAVEQKLKMVDVKIDEVSQKVHEESIANTKMITRDEFQKTLESIQRSFSVVGERIEGLDRRQTRVETRLEMGAEVTQERRILGFPWTSNENCKT